jgi:hypothetical protein
MTDPNAVDRSVENNRRLSSVLGFSAITVPAGSSSDWLAGVN